MSNALRSAHLRKLSPALPLGRNAPLSLVPFNVSLFRWLPVCILTLPVSPRDHLKGQLTSGLTLVQYGDYQCPNCGAIYPSLLNLLDEMGDRICFVFRHFPRSDLHAQAHIAAEAAEAAASQGRFWQMHHCLMTHQQALGNGYLVEYALELGLDVPQFLQEMTSDQHVPRVQEDVASALASGVEQTPTFFIDGKPYDGLPSREVLLQALAERVPTSEIPPAFNYPA